MSTRTACRLSHGLLLLLALRAFFARARFIAPDGPASRLLVVQRVYSLLGFFVVRLFYKAEPSRTTGEFVAYYLSGRYPAMRLKGLTQVVVRCLVGQVSGIYVTNYSSN